jgi:hypothetical protein
VLVNDLSLSIRNPVLIYSFLAVYGLLTLLLITYVRAKFRTAERALRLLHTEWESAESQHTTIVGAAQEKLSKLSAPGQSASAFVKKTGAIGTEMRNQIVVMAKGGIDPADIARTCNLQEGEVEVILGIARLQK